jgi:hypothetical protein
MVPDDVLDLSLIEIATATRVSVCSAEPADYAGIAAVSLGSLVLTPGDGNGDFVIADGDTSGRKLTLTEQAALTPTSDGTANYLAFDDGTTLLKTVPMAGQLITTAQSWVIPATKLAEVHDATYA